MCACGRVQVCVRVRARAGRCVLGDRVSVGKTRGLRRRMVAARQCDCAELPAAPLRLPEAARFELGRMGSRVRGLGRWEAAGGHGRTAPAPLLWRRTLLPTGAVPPSARHRGSRCGGFQPAGRGRQAPAPPPLQGFAGNPQNALRPRPLPRWLRGTGTLGRGWSPGSLPPRGSAAGGRIMSSQPLSQKRRLQCPENVL